MGYIIILIVISIPKEYMTYTSIPMPKIIHMPSIFW